MHILKCEIKRSATMAPCSLIIHLNREYPINMDRTPCKRQVNIGAAQIYTLTILMPGVSSLIDTTHTSWCGREQSTLIGSTSPHHVYQLIEQREYAHSYDRMSYSLLLLLVNGAMGISTQRAGLLVHTTSNVNNWWCAHWWWNCSSWSILLIGYYTSRWNEGLIHSNGSLSVYAQTTSVPVHRALRSQLQTYDDNSGKTMYIT